MNVTSEIKEQGMPGVTGQERYARVLVVGGGIGGLSAAIALRQVGCEVDLVELKPTWIRSGVGIIQPGNALRALDTLGVAQRCIEQGFAYAGYDYFAADGSLMYASAGPQLTPGLPAFNGILRGRLHDILLQRATACGANIRLGLTVAELRQDATQAQVRFSDSSEAGYHLVVGADGIYSPLRERYFGAAHVATPTGQSVWRLTMPRPADMTRGVMMLGPSSKAGYVPIAPDLMYLLLVTQEAAGAQMPRERLHLMLQERLEGFGGLVARTRHHVVAGSDIVYRPMEVVMMPPPWFTQRLVLIGDAAHASTPHLGQGAAMAIEDAVVLAELVGQQLSPALLGERYMQRRYARASQIQNASLMVGEYEQGKRPGLDVAQLLQDMRACAARTI